MAVFLVVLVLTMVTAIGVFSMHSAGLVDRATGFHRQNVQSAAMVEFGARATATWLGPNKTQILAATDGPAPMQIDGCNPKLVAANARAECWVVKSASLASQLETTAPIAPSDGLLGLLSSPSDSTVIRAELGTEITETFDANAGVRPGSTGKLKEITLTTHSRIFPTDGSTLNSCQAAGRGAISQQKLRAHAIVHF